MPNFCILNNKVITTEDIYKFNIDKSSEFVCYTCEKRLQFRQSRNGDSEYTEHFYHQNTIKDTHIECEKNTYQNVKKDMSKFHSLFSGYLQENCKEILRNIDFKKHIVDGYSYEHNMGVEFQNSKISENDIISRDSITELDWIFNVENQFVRKINIGNFVVCEIPHDNWEKAVKVVKDNCFLFTGKKEWIWLVNRDSYRIEIENIKRNVWIGEICYFNDVLENTCLQHIITNEGKQYFTSIKEEISKVTNIYARCKKSMFLLDDIHREYINHHEFKTNDIVAIKSVAGSGKTTTLLNLSKICSNKRILYLAFNKSLITEIQDKIKQQKIKNLFPQTFDALLYRLYISIKKTEPDIVDLRPQFIGKIINFLDGKPFKLKQYYCNKFSQFCNNAEYNDIRQFSIRVIGERKPLLEQFWEKTIQNKLTTFETIRKQAYVNRWFKQYIDSNYDMIMIDETQDFDMIMLKMLLNDTTIPKIFVGDPLQSIYDFRGCINAFKYLPSTSLVIEFYSTFRVGNPACDMIQEKFENCWMISKSKNETNFVTCLDDTDNYVYLFRSWRVLLETAEVKENIWIYNFSKKLQDIRILHKKLQSFSFNEYEEENQYEDDLPKFLSSIDSSQLEEMIENITNNLVSYENSKCKFYTVHSYKGMENDIIRLANDIDIYDNENIYYVAITRGMKKILID